jgi:hypothetical protein
MEARRLADALVDEIIAEVFGVEDDAMRERTSPGLFGLFLPDAPESGPAVLEIPLPNFEVLRIEWDGEAKAWLDRATGLRHPPGKALMWGGRGRA